MKITFLTGAGISKESGLETFRDSKDGLWGQHKIEDVATYEGWKRNPETVLEFYNGLRLQVHGAITNDAHKAIARIGKEHDVTVITQNIDDLHERAGSKKVYHIHGDIFLAREDGFIKTYDQLFDMQIGEVGPNKVQLRPHVVWFGENILFADESIKAIEESDIFVVVGTSLNVYPAANFIHYAKKEKWVIDPEIPPVTGVWHMIKDVATKGLLEFEKEIEKLKV
jgi:NAD-dependent deacetylase